MSASDKKKLRKELNAATMTERQIEEQKKQKKQKIYTITFAIVMVLVVAIVLCSVLTTPITRMLVNNTVAAKVGSHELSATELNYYYVDYISNVYSQFSSYGDYQYLYCYMSTGWNPSTAAGDQTYDAETGETWADFFADSAVESAKWTYAMYDAATAAGFELSEDDQKSIDSTISYMSLYAYYYGYSDADSYIRAIYGTSADLDSYKEYYTTSYIASAYANEYIDSLEFTDDQIRAHEADKMVEYNSYSWNSYYVNASSYLTGGTTTTGEDGKETTTYSDEEKAAAVDAAKADAEALVNSGSADVTALNTAINALEINKDAETEKTATEYSKYLYDNMVNYTVNEEAVEWLTSEDRTEGDLTYIAYTTEDADGNETVNGYYVLQYVGYTDNKINVGNVRHLLVAFEEDEDGNVTDEAKKAAKLEAEKLLEEYKSGEMTEEAFTTLLTKNSDDVDSDGNVNNEGLYENITPDSGYVSAFTDWAIADHEVGDVEIIETEYGYHIMYYVGAADLNYRDTLINNDLVNEAYTAWEETILEDVTAEAKDLKYIDRDYVMVTSN